MGESIVVPNARALQHAPTYSVVGLKMHPATTYDEWENLGHSLRLIAKAGPWWWGDWLAFGERKWGEKYAQAVEESDYTYGALRNAAYVCKAVPLSRRRDKLSFSHHVEVAALPPDLQDEVLVLAELHSLTRNQTRAAAQDALRKRQAEEAEAAAAEIPDTALAEVRVGDFRSVLANVSAVDAIITDPPYPEKYVPLLLDLSAVGKRILKPGGWCAVMIGQSYLPQVMEHLGTWLRYHWTVAYLTPGGQAAQVWQRKVETFWKPVLLYTNGDRDQDGWLGDVAKSAVNDNDKRFHDWGQSESGMSDLVKRLTMEGDLICDPFMGAGTTGVVAVAAGRRFIGCDTDAEHVATASARIKQAAHESG